MVSAFAFPRSLIKYDTMEACCMSSDSLEHRCGAHRAALASNRLKAATLVGETSKISVRFDNVIQYIIIYTTPKHNLELFQLSLKERIIVPYHLWGFNIRFGCPPNGSSVVLFLLYQFPISLLVSLTP